MKIKKINFEFLCENTLLQTSLFFEHKLIYSQKLWKKKFQNKFNEINRMLKIP
jgi:hypothetical protein